MKEQKMDATVTERREGDIFRWAYREPGDDRQWGRYHCCSRIAIVDAYGRLRDTYWSWGRDGRIFTHKDLPALELTYLGNLADLEKVPEHLADYYDDADIVDLNHANSPRGNFYIRKGAARSAKKMLESARYQLEKSVSDERTAARRSEQLRETIARIESGEIENIFI